MKRIRLLALMVLVLAIPAAAQVMQVQRIESRPMIVPVLPAPSAQTQSGDLSFDPALDPDKARALIAKLRSEKRALRDQMTVTLGDLQQARTVIDEMTRAGGTLVRAQCVSDSLSQRTDGGGEENCSVERLHLLGGRGDVPAPVHELQPVRRRLVCDMAPRAASYGGFRRLTGPAFVAMTTSARPSTNCRTDGCRPGCARTGGIERSLAPDFALSCLRPRSTGSTALAGGDADDALHLLGIPLPRCPVRDIGGGVAIMSCHRRVHSRDRRHRTHWSLFVTDVWRQGGDGCRFAPATARCPSRRAPRAQRCAASTRPISSRHSIDSCLNRFVASDESIPAECRCGDMAWSPRSLASSVIRGAWYLPKRQQLDLLFTSGRRYIYSNVPMTIANGFAAAESKGRFYNFEIRNRFPCREVERGAGGDRMAERKAAETVDAACRRPSSAA